MPDTRYAYMAPRNAALRWLASPGSGVAPQIAGVLLGELFASPGAVLAGMLAALTLSAVAFCNQGGPVFGAIAIALLAVIPAWQVVVRRIVREAARHVPRPTDLYFALGLAWSSLVGALAFAIMQTHSHPLQLMAATIVTAMGAPVCARNYAVPRFAVTLLCLPTLPFVAGAVLFGQGLLLVLVAQLPLFIFGCMSLLRRFNRMALAALRAEAESYQVARHDCLTGLLNRFGLLETLDRRCASLPHRFILFYLDLDGFKPINDVFGHHAGDAMLAAVANRLRSAIGPNDIASRLGGDEFVIVAPDMAPAEGSAFAERIITAIATEPYSIDDVGELRIGISVGFACAPEDGNPGDDLHRKADAALYEAKGAGKGVHRRFRDSAPKPEQAKPARRTHDTAANRAN